jgi:hypothetical protein
MAEWEIRLIINEGGDSRVLRDLLVRLRCRNCRAKPSGVMLANTGIPPNGTPWSNVQHKDGRTRLILWDDDAQR